MPVQSLNMQAVSSGGHNLTLHMHDHGTATLLVDGELKSELSSTVLARTQN